MATAPPFLAPTSLPLPSSERLGALYAFTRAQRDSNPDGYASNVRWWGLALGGGLAAGTVGASRGEGGKGRDTLVLRVDDALMSALARDGVRPRGIAGVVDSLAAGTPPALIPLQRFMDSPTPLEQGPSIASRLVGVGWSALGRLSPFSGGEVSEESLAKSTKGKEYAYLPGVKAAAAKFAERLDVNPIVTYTDALFSRATFLGEFGDIMGKEAAGLSKRDVDVLVRWLARDVGTVVVEGDVIKILYGGQVASDHPITEADRGALSVLATLARVDAQITDIELESQACQDKARRQLSLGNRTTATSYLRSKKNLDDVLAKRVATGEQLRSVVRALDGAKTDAEVVSAYEASTAALATALKDPRLQPDRIAATTDALADALADQREIDEAVRMGGALATGQNDVDEDELAKELAALVLEEKEEKEKREVEERRRADAAAAAAAAAKVPSVPAAGLGRSQEPAKVVPSAPTTPPVVAPAAPARGEATEWAQRHAEAQERDAAEKARAADEQLKRDEHLMHAE